MSGRVIVTPQREHSCSPGWSQRAPQDGEIHWHAPLACEYPPGTVWRCDCGRVWVSVPPVLGSPGLARFRPERRREKHRRERAR